MMTSLDGYMAGPDGDISWHVVGEEFNEFAIRQLQSVDTLLFGRVTYDLMASYWPTPAALTDDPVVTEIMNTTPKIVFSRTLEKADWQNTRLVKGDAADEVAKLKEQLGKDMIVFGSSDLSAALLNRGLLDEIRVMVNPVLLGGGKSVFGGIDAAIKLTLLDTRRFSSGTVLHSYKPAKVSR